MKITEHMNCLSDAELRHFVRNPLTADHAETATHIFSCDSCAARLLNELDIQATGTDFPEATEAEPVDFREFWRMRKQKDLWIQVSELLERGQTRKESVPEFTWTPGLSILPNAAASANPGMGTATPVRPQVNLQAERFERVSASPQATPAVPRDQGNDQVELAFVSQCDKSKPLFWQAVLTLHLSANQDDTLTIKISDKTGSRIPAGQMLFLGRVLPVINGLAGITLRDFQRGLKNPSVAFRFATGETVEGEISLLKQGELS